MKFPLILALALLAGPALADVSAGSESQSAAQSYSGINFNQARGYKGSPSMGAPSVMGECGGQSGALSGPGFGLSLGGGNGSRKCNLRADTAMVAALAGNQVAIAHLCLNDRDLQRTLSAYGLCPRAAAAPIRSPRPAAAAAYSKCERRDGAIRVGVRRGHSKADAVAACRASLQ